MIDSLVKVSEKIAALVEHRQKRQMLDYGTCVAPLYGTLVELHNETLPLLEEVRQSFQDRVPVLKIQATVQTCRLKNVAQRQDLAAKIAVFREAMDDRLYDDFYRCAQTYLFNPRINTLSRTHELAESAKIRPSTVRTLLSAVLSKTVDLDRIVTASGLTPAENRVMIGYLDLVIEEARDSWQRLAVAHAKVQVSLRR